DDERQRRGREPRGDAVAGEAEGEPGGRRRGDDDRHRVEDQDGREVGIRVPVHPIDQDCLRHFLLHQRAKPNATDRGQRGLRRRRQGGQDQRDDDDQQLDPGGGVHQIFWRYLKSSLTERSSCTRRIASASRGATERTLILGCCLSGGNGIESVITISSRCELTSFSTASPASTPWVARTRTLVAPSARSACETPTRVPPVEIRSSTMTASIPSTSPTTRCSLTTSSLGRRL